MIKEAPRAMARLQTNALAFSDLHFRSPMHMLDELHSRVARAAQVNVLGAWPKLLNATDLHNYVFDENVLFHPSVPQSFAETYFDELPGHAPTPTQRQAWRATAPFTFTECRVEMQPTGRDTWLFDLLNKHRMRDGLYCPTNRWIVVYWSPKRLAISEQTRAALNFAASQAAANLSKMIPKPKRSEMASPKLTRREYDVLYNLSMGRRPRQIADALGISVATVRNFIVSAQKKLGARTPTQAVAEAYRRALVK